MKSFIGSVLFLAAAAIALWFLLFRGDAPAEGPPPGSFGLRPVAVTLVAVERGNLAETVELTGDVVSARRSAVGFRRAGQVVEVDAEPGQQVAAGQLLARLDDAVLVQQVAAAEAALAAAREAAAAAEREARRAVEVGEDIVPAVERDARAREAAAAALLVAQREAELARLRAEQDQGLLRAPFAAAVVERRLSEGAYAAAGAPVLELVDLGRREVRVQVPSRYAARLGPGAAVRLRCDELPGQDWALRIDRFVPAADAGSRNFLAVVELDAADGAAGLLPGMFVRAELTRAEAVDALLVPVDTLRQTERGHALVAAGPPGEQGLPTARLCEVQVLARGGGLAAVRPLEGEALATGDRVVLTGRDLVGPESVLAPLEG